MSKQEKLRQRFLSKPTDFTWPELVTLMSAYRYSLKTTGGSGRKFVREQTFLIHEPHPHKLLKAYQLRALTAFLKQQGDIE